MPIEVEDIVEPEDVASKTEVAPETADPSAADAADVEPAPVAKRGRGRPPGSKNKPRVEAPSEPAAPEPTVPEPPQPDPPKPVAKSKPKAKPAAKRTKVVAPPPSETSEESSEEEAPLSPAAQRRAQWTAYRQKQVDAHQQRVTHYTNALDKMLGF